VGDNGSGSIIHREFCGDCGSYICEYGVCPFALGGLVYESGMGALLIDVGQDAVKNDFRYICVGTLDDPEVLPPKGEFFCQSRVRWMPEIPGE
jgi:hypothetical protein